ncbi:MAG: hypothetical protein FWC64_11655 [Treponema sp.]|nr:hypothetical protein [Treponema sp.]
MDRLSISARKGPRGLSAFSFLALFCLPLLWASCNSAAVPNGTVPLTEVPITIQPPAPPLPQPSGGGGGIVDQIRFHTERGTPESILYALEIIRSRDLGFTEFGRMMNFVNVTLLGTLYPSVRTQLPPRDPPLTHIYARILREVEAGVYTSPRPNSVDYLEFVLPFLAYYPDRSRSPDGPLQTGIAERVVPAQRFLAVLPDLRRAQALNSESVLAGYFIGVVYEQTGRLQDASTQYSRMWDQFPEFFPAALGIARIMDTQSNLAEVMRFLQDVMAHFPGNLQVKRQLALAYYRLGNWPRAGALATAILQENSRDAKFVLMRAHILVEQGQFLSAQSPLDIFATINPSNTLYLFLRARVQAEGFNNRNAALNYLRTILRSPQTPANRDIHDQATVYAARLLLTSPVAQDQDEGRELLGHLMAVPSPSLEVIALALDDAIRREAWTAARGYLNRLLGQRRSFQDLLAAHTLERAQGNNAAALAFARELHRLAPANDDGIIAYISALIDSSLTAQASTMIENRLTAVPSGPLRSRYLYLRSRIRDTEALAMADLRSSLFEYPRNLDSLIAMFEIHHHRRDERRALYYLRQALAIAPDNPRLRRYAAEYALVLGGGV